MSPFLKKALQYQFPESARKAALDSDEASIAYWADLGLPPLPTGTELIENTFKVFKENEDALNRAIEQGYDLSELSYHWSPERYNEFDFGRAQPGLHGTDLMGMHSGTMDAAIERAIAKLHYSNPSQQYLDKVGKGNMFTTASRGRKNPLLSEKGLPYTEGQLRTKLHRMGRELGVDSNTREGAEAIRNRIFEEYDAIPYFNQVEDQGSISWIDDPRNVRDISAEFSPEKLGKSDMYGNATPEMLATIVGSAPVGLDAINQREWSPSPYENSMTPSSVAEAIAAIATGAAGMVGGGLAGLGGAMLPGEPGQGARVAQIVQDVLTYDPTDPTALQAIGQTAQVPAQAYEAATDFLADTTLSATGSPTLATIAKMAPDLISGGVMLKSTGMKMPKLSHKEFDWIFE